MHTLALAQLLKYRKLWGVAQCAVLLLCSGSPHITGLAGISFLSFFSIPSLWAAGRSLWTLGAGNKEVFLGRGTPWQRASASTRERGGGGIWGWGTMASEGSVSEGPGERAEDNSHADPEAVVGPQGDRLCPFGPQLLHVLTFFILLYFLCRVSFQFAYLVTKNVFGCMGTCVYVLVSSPPRSRFYFPFSSCFPSSDCFSLARLVLSVVFSLTFFAINGAPLQPPSSFSNILILAACAQCSYPFIFQF